MLEAGATQVILGSRLFAGGVVDTEFVRRLAEAVGPERLIAAVDSRGGRVVIDGWRTALDLTPIDAVRALEPYFGEFLYTHVDLEGLMQRDRSGRDRGHRQRHPAETNRRGRNHHAGGSRLARRPRHRCGGGYGPLYRAVGRVLRNVRRDGPTNPSAVPAV